jgi:hypothetical protein
MNIGQASVFSDRAQISVVGAENATGVPSDVDVYLYVQVFNMPKQVVQDDLTRLRARAGELFGQPALGAAALAAGSGQGRWTEIEEIAAFYPTYIVHAYHDTHRRMTLEDGRQIPILRPQTAFGYFIGHEGPLVGWETRLYGAEKIAENFYRLAVPHNGSAYVEPAIQARSSDSEEPIPETRPGDKKNGCLAQILRLFGIGKK